MMVARLALAGLVVVGAGYSLELGAWAPPRGVPSVPAAPSVPAVVRHLCIEEDQYRSITRVSPPSPDGTCPVGRWGVDDVGGD